MLSHLLLSYDEMNGGSEEKQDAMSAVLTLSAALKPKVTNLSEYAGMRTYCMTT